MAMDRWVEGQIEKGNDQGALFGRLAKQAYGDITLRDAEGLGAMEVWTDGQVQVGDTKGIEVGKALRRRYGDVSYLREIGPVDLKRFSDEARQELEAEGYLIYTLSGKSVNDYIKDGRVILQHKSGREDDFKYRVASSVVSQVAIKPDSLILEGSDFKNLREQEEMVDEFSAGISRRIKGVKAVIGEAADYTGVAFAHLDATGEMIFKRIPIRTKTPIGFSQCIVIEGVDKAPAGASENSEIAGRSLHFMILDETSLSFGPSAMPLVVPA